MGDDKRAKATDLVTKLKQALEGPCSITCGIIGDDIDALETSVQHNFFSLINHTEFRHVLTKAGDERVNQLRCALGVWYSAMILGDALAYDPSEASPERRLEQRMQALVKEALAWLPEALLAQVVLKFRGNEKEPILECAGVTDHAPSGCLNEFRKKIRKYVAAHGTSVDFNIHLRRSHRIDWEGQCAWCESAKTGSQFVDREPNVACMPKSITAGPLGQLPISNGGKGTIGEAVFFAEVGTPTLNAHKDGHLWMLHIASGLDVDIRAPVSENLTSVAHLFVIRKYPDPTKVHQVSFVRGYEAAMHTLLHKLANFYTANRFMEERARLRKHAHMLALVGRPLQKLSEALTESQHDIQEVYAIMHEPSQTVLVAQQRIAELFRDNHSISNPDGTVVTIHHQPVRYDREPSQWVLAHALARFFGAELIGNSAREALELRLASLRAAVAEKDHVYHEISNAVVRLLSRADRSESHDPLSELEQGLKTDNDQPFKEILTRLKERLFTPFKPDTATQGIKWTVVQCLLPAEADEHEIMINNAPLDATSYAVQQGYVLAVLPGCNPFATQGHLLAFIADVLSQHVKHWSERNVSISLKAQQGYPEIALYPSGRYKWPEAAWTNLNFTSIQPWLESAARRQIAPSAKQTDTLEELKKAMEREKATIEAGGIGGGEYGDLFWPFVRLVRRCTANSLPDIGPINISKANSLAIRWPNLAVEFDGENFTIRSHLYSREGPNA